MDLPDGSIFYSLLFSEGERCCHYSDLWSDRVPPQQRGRKEGGELMIYLQLFWSFFQIGLFSFGGGYAAVPLIQSQIV